MKNRTPEATEEGKALLAAIHARNAGLPAEQRITQTKAASLMGITPTALSRYLQGYNPLNLKLCTSVYRIYGIPTGAYSPRLAEFAEEVFLMVSENESKSLPIKAKHAIRNMVVAVDDVLSASAVNLSSTIVRLEEARNSLVAANLED